jgi:hypothetical protein
VGRFKDGCARRVIDVRAGHDANTADLRGQRVREVIAVEVQRRHPVAGGSNLKALTKS